MQRGSLLVAVVCYALAILIFINSFSRLMLDSTILGTRRNGISGQLNTPSKARNSSLGFGAIYVLTEDPTTWRVQGLIQAAESVGLYLNVPVQQHLSTEEVESQLSGAAVRAKPAVARLTLNYLTLLEEFLNTTLETVLFVKNDVEFSIYIKTQAALFSKAIWANVPNAERPDIDTVHADDYPYGFDTWDVLWLGHYGIEFTVATEVFANTDPYALPWSQLSSNFNEYYQSLRSKFVDEGIQQQQVLRGIAPIATYAWAVTRQHAEKLLHQLRKPRSRTLTMLCILRAKIWRKDAWCPCPNSCTTTGCSVSRSLTGTRMRLRLCRICDGGAISTNTRTMFDGAHTVTRQRLGKN